MTVDTTNAILLVGSNLFILPAIFVACYHRLITEVAILTTMGVVSTIYHTCQVGIGCVVAFSVLQISDHFFVFSTIVWLILFFWDIRIPYRFAIFILVSGFLLPTIMDKIGTWWPSALAAGAIILISICILAFLDFKAFRFDWIDLLIAILLIGIGVVFFVFAGEPSLANNYIWAHALWHVFAMLAIFFVIELKVGGSIISQALRKYRSKERLQQSDMAYAEATVKPFAFSMPPSNFPRSMKRRKTGKHMHSRKLSPMEIAIQL